MEAIDVDGVRLRVAVRGTGQPLLLLTGIGGNLGMWGPFEDALDPDVIRTITVDAPGTGGSTEYCVPRRMHGLARTMDRMLDALGYDSVDLLGVSFGGVLAQQLAHQAPHRIRRLVLAATGPGLGGVPADPGSCWRWRPRAATGSRTTSAGSPGRSTAGPPGATRMRRCTGRWPASPGHRRPGATWTSCSPSRAGPAFPGCTGCDSRRSYSPATTIPSSRSSTAASSAG
jgi:pimeloyl-ACP methyl ester carboxylesterase